MNRFLLVLALGLTLLGAFAQTVPYRQLDTNDFRRDLFPAVRISTNRFPSMNQLTNGTLDLEIDLLTVGSQITTNQTINMSTVLLQSGTNVTVNMATNSPSRRWIVATNDLNFTVTNAVDGSTVDLGIFSGTTNRNLTFANTNLTWFGAPAPTVLASNHFARLTFQYWSGLTNYHCFFSPSLP